MTARQVDCYVLPPGGEFSSWAIRASASRSAGTVGLIDEGEPFDVVGRLARADGTWLQLVDGRRLCGYCVVVKPPDP